MLGQRTADRGPMQARGTFCACFFETPRMHGRNRPRSGPSLTIPSPLAGRRRCRSSTQIRGVPSVVVIAMVKRRAGQGRAPRFLRLWPLAVDGFIGGGETVTPRVWRGLAGTYWYAEADARWVELLFGWRQAFVGTAAVCVRF
jgi:hypothetical protein